MSEPYRCIRKAAVLGAGVMGGGIAALLAGVGIETLLLDIVPLDLTGGEKSDPKARNRIAKAGLDAALNASPPLFYHKKDAARITIGNMEDDFDKLAGCDWIVEVVVENLKIKRQLFKRVETVRKEDAVVSSNTSGIPLHKMSEGLSESFRKHFLGTHFFNPVRYMKLLEIIPGEETLPSIVEFMSDFGERRLGKGIVRAKDTPNFIGNRIGVQGIVMAMQRMVADGLTIPEVDALFGPALGRPKTAMFKTTDLVGLDVMGHVAENTYEMVPHDEKREDFRLPDFVKKMVENKQLGKKTNAGFYKTDLTPEWKKIRKVIDPDTLEYAEYESPAFDCLGAAGQAKTLPEKMRAVVYGTDKGAKYAWKVMADSLIYAANRIPEIADTVVEIDNAMKWGFNFELGPFETWDAIGVAESVEKMKSDGFSVPEKIERMVSAGYTAFYKMENGRRFYYDFSDESYREIETSDRYISLHALRQAGKTVKTCKSASLIDLGDDVFCVEFHTRMNAVNGEIVQFMEEAAGHVEKYGAGLVVGNQAGGMPGAFSVGGDLKFMSELAQKKKFDEIDRFLAKAQTNIQRARYAPFPVVAAPFGLTLGGGCEICLGTDRIVAHAELYMGLVEIGVGLLPAGGGCLNYWKKITESIPETVKDVDLAKYFTPAFMNIALATVSSSAKDARRKGFLGPCDRIVMNRDQLIAEAKREVLRMAEDGYAPPVKRSVRVLGRAAQGMVNAEIANMRAGGFVSEYDAFLAKRIAFVLSGGESRDFGEVDEEVLLTLEREAFVDFWKEEKTGQRVAHMLKTGKPLRN